MNHRKIAIVLLSTVLVFGQIQAQGGAKPFIYPVAPGMKQWMEMKSVEEKRKACQIPQEVLKNLSTSDLVETCLNYPLFRDVFLFDNIQEGFNMLVRNFNGMQELLSRPDAVSTLMSTFASVDPEGYDPNWASLLKGTYAIRLSSIEILLAQRTLLDQLDRAKSKALVGECLQKVQNKVKHPDIYGSLELTTTTLLAGRALQKENFPPLGEKAAHNAQLQSFLKNAFVADASLLNEVLNCAIQFNNGN
jgi:hypothetical protein